jgi:hypothetical protein
MKFEMEIGFIQNEKITVETWDWDKITEIQKFIQFMQERDWCVEYEAVDLDFEDEEETEEEEVPAFALDAHEPL